jgi:hypothetical protein
MKKTINLERIEIKINWFSFGWRCSADMSFVLNLPAVHDVDPSVHDGFCFKAFE